MGLKNKDIAEGMYVTNGKQVWKVIIWDENYNHALLRKIDDDGNKTNSYVIAERYTLNGTEKDPQITWINGYYITRNHEDRAIDDFVDWVIEDEKQSIKESAYEDFSLYNLNKETKFVNKWLKQLGKNFENISVDSIYSNEIWFRLWVDEIPLKIRIFDEIATECMPKTLIEFIDNKNINFYYEFLYRDDYMTINDFVFIKFVAW